MKCPICLYEKVALVNYDSVYCIENKQQAENDNILLDTLFHCQVKCFRCQWSEWISADIVYPQPKIALRYCLKDTINYDAFIQYLIQNKGAWIRRKLTTKEEPAICVLSYNKFWSEFRYHVDGVVYSSSRDFDYVLKEYNNLFPFNH